MTCKVLAALQHGLPVRAEVSGLHPATAASGLAAARDRGGLSRMEINGVDDLPSSNE